jgi:hypothetical protein
LKRGARMINTIKEFAAKYPKSVIVNYDIAGTFDDESGRTYRTSTGNLEYFRKENGKYLKFPQIQPYLKLSENADHKLFILYNHKMFELEKIDVNYHIKREIEDINPSLYMDDVFYDKKNLRQPRIQDEEILIIKE